jgi:hypothetical protein
MNASAKIFSIVMMFFFFCGTFVQDASARPDRKRGICFFLTSMHLSPKQFAKGYESEKKENARLFEKSRRRMAHKQNGWGLFRFLSENHREANPTRFQ